MTVNHSWYLPAWSPQQVCDACGAWRTSRTEQTPCPLLLPGDSSDLLRPVRMRRLQIWKARVSAWFLGDPS